MHLCGAAWKGFVHPLPMGGSVGTNPQCACAIFPILFGPGVLPGCSDHSVRDDLCVLLSPQHSWSSHQGFCNF